MYQGSIELLSEDETISEGLIVTTPDPARLPDGLAILRGLGEFREIDPPRAGVDMEWTARTHDGFEVVVLWREARLAGPVLR